MKVPGRGRSAPVWRGRSKKKRREIVLPGGVATWFRWVKRGILADGRGSVEVDTTLLVVLAVCRAAVLMVYRADGRESV